MFTGKGMVGVMSENTGSGYGASGSRTHTVSPPADFKSAASAYSAIAPALIYSYIELLIGQENLARLSLAVCESIQQNLHQASLRLIDFLQEA